MSELDPQYPGGVTMSREKWCPDEAYQEPPSPYCRRCMELAAEVKNLERLNSEQGSEVTALRVRITELERELKEALSAMEQLHKDALPDPHDERDVCPEWLSRRIHEAWGGAPMTMADVVVCSTCYGDVPKPSHPGPNYCSRACEPWAMQKLRERISELEGQLATSRQQTDAATHAWDRAMNDRDEAREWGIHIRSVNVDSDDPEYTPPWERSDEA